MKSDSLAQLVTNIKNPKAVKSIFTSAPGVVFPESEQHVAPYLEKFYASVGTYLLNTLPANEVLLAYNKSINPEKFVDHVSYKVVSFLSNPAFVTVESRNHWRSLFHKDENVFSSDLQSVVPGNRFMYHAMSTSIPVYEQMVNDSSHPDIIRMVDTLWEEIVCKPELFPVINVLASKRF